MPNAVGTVKYEGEDIPVKGHTIIKAVAVNAFGVKSDVGIFEYVVTPEAPKAAPSATVGRRPASGRSRKHGKGQHGKIRDQRIRERFVTVALLYRYTDRKRL